MLVYVYNQFYKSAQSKMLKLVSVLILFSIWQTHSMRDQLIFNPFEPDIPRVTPYRSRRQQTDNNSTTPQLENITLNDDHDYYTSQLYPSDTNKLSEVWVELSSLPHTHHYHLSKGYFLAQSFQLDFRFPFYGQNINQLYVTTHGFISTAPFVHSLLPFSQYIAPFSANFNPNLSNSSAIHVLSDAGRFIVQWDSMYLNDTNQSKAFTFQTQLFPCGQIRFAYLHAPLTIQQANQSMYSSFIGLADGFIWHSLVYTYIIHFHDVTLSQTLNLEGSVYYMDPLPSCAQATGVDECRNTSCATGFKCNWCTRTNKCIQSENSLSWTIRNACLPRYQTGFSSCPANATTTFLPTCYSGRSTSPRTSIPTDATVTNIAAQSDLAIRVGLPIAAVLLLLLLVSVIVSILVVMWRLKGRISSMSMIPRKLSKEIILEPEDAAEFAMNEYS